MTAPNVNMAVDECGCTEHMPCLHHAQMAYGKGLVKRPDETERQFVRRCIAENPTLSKRAIGARRRNR